MSELFLEHLPLLSSTGHNWGDQLITVNQLIKASRDVTNLAVYCLLAGTDPLDCSFWTNGTV